MIFLQTVVVCTLLCLCLSTTPEPGWWARQMGRLFQEKYRGPVALDHEQTIAVVTHNGPDDTIDRCHLILAESNDKFDKHTMLQHLATKMPVEKVNFQTMLSVVQTCQDIQTVGANQDYSDNEEPNETIDIWALAKGILPGTLWCGVDDIADNYYSLGPDWQIDKCCRAHDHCPLKVKPFKTRYGVFNIGPYTKSHCACDQQFYDCLKKVNNSKSNSVGNIFFNVIGVKCVEKRVRRRCVQYENSDIELKREGKTLTEASEKVFNIGVSAGIQNKSQCLVWRNDPPETARFVTVNVKEKY